MSKTPFLNFYKKYYGNEMPELGLCNSLKITTLWREKFKGLFIPDYEEYFQLGIDGYDQTYWAPGLKAGHKKEDRGFTPPSPNNRSFLCSYK